MIVHEDTAETDDASSEGRRFGRRWAPQLRRALEDYDRLFAESGVDRATVQAVADGCGVEVARYAPDVDEELRGMAEGSGLSLREILVLGARTEILAGTRPSMECSTTVHVPEGGSAPRTLQTWDWHQGLSDETVVRRLRTPGGVRVATFCEFGQPAKIGVNDHGLGVHFNILHHRDDGSRAGVPVHVLARMILADATTVAEAVTLAEAVPLAASSVLTVVSAAGGSPGAAAIEVSPAGVAVIPVPPGHTLGHTNHFLDASQAAGEYEPYETTSRPRLDCLTAAAELTSIPDSRQRALAFGAIADAPISVRPRADQPAHLRWETKLTIALDVAGGKLELSAAAPADVAGAPWRVVAA